MTEGKLYQSVLLLLKDAGVDITCILAPSVMLIPNDKNNETYFLLVSLFFESRISRLTVVETCLRSIKALIQSDLLEGIEGGLHTAVFIELSEEERHPRRSPFRKVARISIQRVAYELALNLAEEDIYPEKSTNELTIVGKWFRENS